MTSEDDGPLCGVRVLDFTRILSGPYCSLLLADQGAEVIKIESPDGDDTRKWGPPFLSDGTSTYFAALNRGKKSVVVDMATAEGRKQVHALAARADVVVENFRPGVAERLGIDYATLRQINPPLVMCSISGFGDAGEYAGLAGTEIIIEAMTGVMAVTGEPDGDPVRFGPAMIDIATGLTASTKIVAALLRAKLRGSGAHVKCSLYATALASLGTLVAGYGASGESPRRWGSHHPSIAPYGGFRTSDGYVVTGAINERSWKAFADLLDLAVIDNWSTNAGRVADRSRLHQEITAATVQRTTAEWVTVLRAEGLLAAPIRSVGEAVDDPVTRAMNLLVDLTGEGRIYAPRVDGEMIPPGTHQPAPLLGEHTNTYLSAEAP